MRVGIVLPQFSDDAERAVEVAREAEDAGLDGVFVFDHLWPLGQPHRPALHGPTLLAAVAAETGRVAVGSLVARVGLVPDAVLVHIFASLARLAGDRLVTGLGTGDRGNRPENEAYGIPYEPMEQRRRRLRACCQALRALGVRTWVGGVSPAAREMAAVEADGWNGWGLTAETFAVAADHLRALAADAGTVPEATWAGQVLVASTPAEAAAKLERHGDRPGLVHGTVDEVARQLRGLADAGASWAVGAPLDVGTDPDTVAILAEVAGRLR